ncbi:MAG: MBL fold metallo-hydrolase [Proteobacteria bacterium]|nr:MBL fold metallo-hydrolase [Pseudomonadota bacterium]
MSLVLVASVAMAEPAMKVHFVDIGQGSATLIEFPCGTVLVDVGGEGIDDERARFKGDEALDAYLKTHLGERPLDLLILTHSHMDHVSGLDMILKKYPPKRVLDNGRPGAPGEDGEKGPLDYLRPLHDWISENQIPYRAIEERDVPTGGPLVDEVIDPFECGEVKILWGGSSRRGDNWDNPNNHSIVVRFELGEASALITGDLEIDGIRELLSRIDQDLLDADIWAVGHHGSHNGTTSRLLDAITPEIAVISMGPTERHGLWTAYAFGHPRQTAIDMLERAVLGTRSPSVYVPVASGVRQFREQSIDRAIYGTGWDGSVVAIGKPDGSWTVTTTGR